LAVKILFPTYVALMLSSEVVFWISFCIVFYTYAGYPLLLLALTLIKKTALTPRAADNHIYGAVTLLVAAYNEEECIEEKISNCVSLNYPSALLKIIFISDGSDDNTSTIINKYPQILHLHEDERRGKVAAINRAMKFVETDVVIFSDANTLLNKDSVSQIMKHYSDKKVGGVAGEKRIISTRNDGAVVKGEGLYWKYESLLKRLDSELYTIVGAAGELFSVRSSLYTSLPENIILDDFVQSLLVCTKGYVVRYEPEAYSEETASISVKDEMERKIRITAGGFQAMGFLKKLFNVFSNPLLSFQYLSHRVLRWTICPLALIVLLASSAFIWKAGGHALYGYFALLQGAFYALALAGWLLAANNRQPGVFYVPFYFVFMNFCVFAGFARYVTGKQEAVWKKAVRTPSRKGENT
jgi:cellulose synthase/poly-beta-1,6-N-acetylglucosamine synthase-like glycosyltransferase